MHLSCFSLPFQQYRFYSTFRKIRKLPVVWAKYSRTTNPIKNLLRNLSSFTVSSAFSTLNHSYIHYKSA